MYDTCYIGVEQWNYSDHVRYMSLNNEKFDIKTSVSDVLLELPASGTLNIKSVIIMNLQVIVNKAICVVLVTLRLEILTSII